MSTEEIKKIMSQNPLDAKDYEPCDVQMKIRVGFLKKSN